MSKYLNVNGVTDAINVLLNEVDADASTMEKFCDAMNDIDEVELVRCEDCKHRVFDKERNLYYCEMYYGLGIVKDDNYCSYGERADNE